MYSLVTLKTKYTFSELIDDNRYKPLAISKLGYVDFFIQRIYIPMLYLHYLKRKKNVKKYFYFSCSPSFCIVTTYSYREEYFKL